MLTAPVMLTFFGATIRKQIMDFTIIECAYLNLCYHSTMNITIINLSLTFLMTQALSCTNEIR